MHAPLTFARNQPAHAEESSTAHSSPQRPGTRPRPGYPHGARRAVAAMAAGALVVVLAGACGGDDNTTATATQPAPTTSASWTGSAGPATGAPGTAAATTVTVTETEFKLELSQNTFSPGTYTFVAKNDGQATHALEIEGPGVNDAETAKLGPGESGDLTVTLQAGTYKLYCPVGNHEAQGMTLNITVA